MSAKLLYSLSDDNSNLQKQVGCMNGFLQFFDPHHFARSQGANNPNNRILPSDGNRHHGGANGSSWKIKGKPPKVRYTQEHSPESSRTSLDNEWSITNGKLPSNETICIDKHECMVNQPYSSPCQSNMSHRVHGKHKVHDSYSTCPSPIKTAARELVVRHQKKNVDSSRILPLAKKDSPRVVNQSESFRSVSSNQSAPILPLGKKNPIETTKDSPRLSYGGRETRDTDVSILKLRELPRLSLDSRQRTIKEYVRESKDDLVLRHLQRETQNHRNTYNLPEEPASYRPPSNIVAKLMGLEALPDCSPIKILVERDDSSKCGSSDILSNLSKATDESKLKGGVYSQQNNSSESKTPQVRKNKLVESKNIKHSLDQHKNSRTVYAKIEERMKDLDFTRSGTDLRALKQIIESIHRENTKVPCRNEDSSSGCYDSDSSSYISHKQGLREPASQLQEKRSRSTKDTKSKPDTFVRDFKQEFPQKNLKQIRIGKPGNGIKDATPKTPSKSTTLAPNHFKDPSHQTHRYTHNTLGERTPRPKPATNGLMTKVNVQSPVRISKTVSKNTRSHIIATAVGSKTKSMRSQTEKPGRNSYISKGVDGLPKVISTASRLLIHEKQVNKFSSKHMTEVGSQMPTVLTSTDQPGVKDNNAEAASGDASSEELPTAAREQPSPVSVLDTNFYEDESPSPVKKKLTAFRDYETNATDTAAEWRDIDLTYSQKVLRRSISYEKKDIKVDNFSQAAQALRKINYSPRSSTDSIETPEENNLAKAYVTEIFQASGILDDITFNAVNLQVGQSQIAIDPKIFGLLEQTKGRRYLLDNRSTSKHDTIMGLNERHRRKLLFDTVNEIFSQKLSSANLGARPLLLKKISASSTDHQVLNEIFAEINQIQDNSMHQSLDDENDFLTAIIEKDLAHATGNWTNIISEIPGLVLNIERLIFKDLIVELVN